MIKHGVVAVCMWASCAMAVAGSVSGVHVVWVNLSATPQTMDNLIARYLDSAAGKEDCWEEGSLLFMKSRPKKMSDALVTSAVIAKDPAAQKILSAMLRQPYGDAVAGFDGIIVYSEQGGPRYDSLTTGRNKVATLEVNPDNADIGICVVMPDAVRQP